MTERAVLFLPQSKTHPECFLNLDTISKIEVDRPRELNVPLKEVKTKVPRPEFTKWRCIVYHGTVITTLIGEEARIFIEEIIAPTSFVSESILKYAKDIEDRKHSLDPEHQL